MADSKRPPGPPHVTGHIDDVETRVHAALRALGLQIPSTDDEVRQAEIELAGGAIELPAALRDPDFLWNQSDCEAASESIHVDFTAGDQTAESLARAAREGKTISEEVEARMRRDRELSEKQRNERT